MSEPYSSPGGGSPRSSSAGDGSAGDEETVTPGPAGATYPGPGEFGPPTLMSPADQRTWSMVAHLAHLVGSVVGIPALGPLAVFLIVKDRGPFARRQAVEALNFQLLLLAVYVGAIVLSLVTLGLGVIVLLPLAGVASLIGLVLTIVAAVQSYQGVDYRYPVSWRLVH